MDYSIDQSGVLGAWAAWSLLLDANDPAMKDDNGITAIEKQMVEGEYRITQ